MKIHWLAISLLAVGLSACQSLPKTTSATPTVTADKAIAFNITGKIGVTTQTADGKQAGSAFYSWAQQDQRFAINLTGALGMGATSISYDGRTATLISKQTDTLTADTPEALLTKATGWHAPISQLPYWVLGRVAPDDTDSEHTDGRLTVSRHAPWSVSLDYQGAAALPGRITIRHDEGHRVVMTISHQQ